MTSEDVWEAERINSPWESLPAAIRSSLVSSIPWSILLRTMCIKGSWMLSTIVLSTSVSSPMMVSLTSFPSFCFISRTIRFIFWNTPEMDTIRKLMAISWRSSVNLRSCLADFMKLSRLSWGSIRRTGEEVTIDSVITISPTRSFKLSSFCRFTEIKLCFTGAAAFCCAVCWAAAGSLLAFGAELLSAFALLTSAFASAFVASTGS